MENNRDVQYDFCPKCGALMRDGVCSSCGYGQPQTVQEETAENVDKVPASVEETMPNVEETATNAEETAPAASYTFSEQNPYAEYVNRTAYSNGAIPPDVPQKQGNGKAWAVAIICITIFVLLFVLLGCALHKLASNVKKLPEKISSEYPDKDYDSPEKNFAESLEENEDEELEDYDYEDFYNEILERAKKNQKESAGDSKDAYNSDDLYYEFGDALRDDLPYSATFKEEEYEEEDHNVSIYCSYPFLEGDIPNIDYLNQIFYEEYLLFLDYYKENVKEDMREDESYQCVIESYVTYMDEEKVSIVFSENAGWDDYYIVTLYCINIDVENGVVLDNTAILEIDDEFSVEFRIREEAQNESDALDWYTDQELTEMMNDPVDLIIFYTPLGMEVGVNHDYGWCTVTYKDYEKYLKHL